MALLDFLNEHERKFYNAGAADFYKLKYLYDATGGENYDKMEFELKLLFRLFESMKPKRVVLNVADLRGVDLKGPTLEPPTFEVTDSTGRDYSVWYRALIYVPLADGVKQLRPDFIFVPGKQTSLFTGMGPTAKPVSIDRERAMRMTTQLKPLQLVVLTRDSFLSTDAGEIDAVGVFLKPRRLLLVSKLAMPDSLKMHLRVNMNFIDHVDANAQKFVDAAQRMIF